MRRNSRRSPRDSKTALVPSEREASSSEVNQTEDIVIVRTPRGGAALPVMRVVMGGVASRHGLSLERLDDMQLAVETVLAEELGSGGDLVLCLSVVSGRMVVRLEGLQNQALKAALLAADPFQPCEGCLLDVRLFLDALVDRYSVSDLPGSQTGEVFAVEMEKRAS